MRGQSQSVAQCDQVLSLKMVGPEGLSLKYQDTIEFIKAHKTYRYLYIAEGLTVGGGRNDD